MESVLMRCSNCHSVNRVIVDKFNLKPKCSQCKTPLSWSNKSVDITSQSYQKEITENPGFTLVEFWSPTCGYCHSMNPMLERFASDKAGIVKLAKINTMSEQTLASQFTIMGVPTFILFKGGRAVDQVNGALNKEQFDSWIQHNLNK